MRRIVLALLVSACLTTPAFAKDAPKSEPILSSDYMLPTSRPHPDRVTWRLPTLRPVEGEKPRPYASVTFQVSDRIAPELRAGFVSADQSTLSSHQYHPGDVIKSRTKEMLGVSFSVGR